MQNFHYNIPTQIYFGKGQIENLGENLKKISDKVLLVYGGGSIKKIGLYDKVCEQLKKQVLNGRNLQELNPILVLNLYVKA